MRVETKARPATVTRRTPLVDLPELLRIDEAARWLGIGKGLAYELARRGDLPSVKLGRLLRVTREGLAQCVATTDRLAAKGPAR